MFPFNLLLFGWHMWRGESGERYRFKITLSQRGIPDGGGIYIFVRRRFVFWLQPLYIGKATDFRSRLIGHERWWEAWWKRGATERHILMVPSAQQRERIEEDLIRHYTPRMNDMLVPRGAGDAPRDLYLRRLWRLRRWWRSHFRLSGERGKNRAV